MEEVVNLQETPAFAQPGSYHTALAEGGVWASGHGTWCSWFSSVFTEFVAIYNSLNDPARGTEGGNGLTEAWGSEQRSQRTHGIDGQRQMAGAMGPA